MSRPFGTADELERRRKRAVQAITDGLSRKHVAAALGVHPNSVSRWVADARSPSGLAAKPPPPPAHGLSDDDLRRLEILLLPGARAHGWPNQLWTVTRPNVTRAMTFGLGTSRVARLIAKHFRRDYHPEHVRKIRKRRLGWTSQKPRRHARERDDAEVARWVGDEFPRIVREAHARNAHLVSLDESGFVLTPTVRRTLAPRGKTPVLSAWDRRDRLPASSAITVSPVAGRPNLYFEVYPHSIKGPQVVQFLADLHCRLGAITVVWDRGPIHDKAKVVRAWLGDHPGVVTEKLPACAPHLNPDEGVWGGTKYGRSANLAAADTDELGEHVVGELVSAKHRPELLSGFIRETELPGVSLSA